MSDTPQQNPPAEKTPETKKEENVLNIFS